MTNNDRTPTAADIRAALARAAARRRARDEALAFIPNDRPADRSRNGQRIPRSVPHRAYR